MTPIEWAIVIVAVVVVLAVVVALIQNPDLLALGLELVD